VGKSVAGGIKAKKQQANVPTATTMKVSPQKSMMSEPSVQIGVQQEVGKFIVGGINAKGKQAEDPTATSMKGVVVASPKKVKYHG
jgi:hypothetical protein